MKRFKGYILLFVITICIVNYSFGSPNQKNKDFVVVIDAGHGGHDPGAVYLNLMY